MHTLEFSQGVLAWRWKWGEEVEMGKLSFLQ